MGCLQPTVLVSVTESGESEVSIPFSSPVLPSESLMKRCIITYTFVMEGISALPDELLFERYLLSDTLPFLICELPLTSQFFQL